MQEIILQITEGYSIDTETWAQIHQNIVFVCVHSYLFFQSHLKLCVPANHVLSGLPLGATFRETVHTFNIYTVVLHGDLLLKMHFHC